MIGRRRVFDIRAHDLQKMVDAGMSHRAIGAVYGCSHKLIRDRLAEYGIRRYCARPDIDAAITKWKNEHRRAG